MIDTGKDDKYMLSGCELIDAENISLPRQNMKLGGEFAKRTSHKLHTKLSQHLNDNSCEDGKDK
jgi:hypothetical protein